MPQQFWERVSRVSKCLMMWRLLTDLVRETVSTLEREWSAGEWVESMQEEIERNEGPVDGRGYNTEKDESENHSFPKRWIEYQKEYDMTLHSWTLKTLEMVKVADSMSRRLCDSVDD